MTREGRTLQPEGFAKPKGYANGMIATGPTIYVGGQIGWEPDGTWVSDDFLYQFGRALDNVLAVVRAGGGQAEDIVRLTIYVTDLEAYRASLSEMGTLWRERMGRHYPAMALVGVVGLVEARAKVEIEATAVLATDAT